MRSEPRLPGVAPDLFLLAESRLGSWRTAIALGLGDVGRLVRAWFLFELRLAFVTRVFAAGLCISRLVGAHRIVFRLAVEIGLAFILRLVIETRFALVA